MCFSQACGSISKLESTLTLAQYRKLCKFVIFNLVLRPGRFHTAHSFENAFGKWRNAVTYNLTHTNAAQEGIRNKIVYLYRVLNV